jgi:hypothetical protein
MIEDQTQEEHKKIKEGLHKISLEQYAFLNKNPQLNDLSENINDNKKKLGFFYKIFRPNIYEYAVKDLDRLNKLNHLWTKEENLVKIIMSETSKDISATEITNLRKNIESLEAEYLATPQFQKSLYPSSTLYELQFQFPDFVESEFKPLLDAPAKDIKWLKTMGCLNEPYNCLVKYAKEHRPIAEKILEKMMEVYELNKGSKKVSYALFSVGCIKLERDALNSVLELGKALGYTEEQINQKVELK